MGPTEDVDAIVIGAGIAGASVAYFMAPHARVLVLEREAQPGVHATGRSAAMFDERYGPPQVRCLTRASRPFLENPPPGFAEHRLLASPRGALTIAGAGGLAQLDGLFDTLQCEAAGVVRLGALELQQRLPVLEPTFAQGGVFDPAAADIDVNELHQGFLRGLKQRGGRVLCDVSISAIERDAGSGWRVHAGERSWRAPLLLNAAGAWADELARLAGVQTIGLEPRRRSAFLFAPPEGLVTAHWPLVLDIDEGFYFKPDAGLLLGSPANADPVPPQDVQPEEFDVALGIHRIETATTLRIRRPTRTWAGLRSFTPEGTLAGGFAPDSAGFFWLAGQGGYGIQTSAAMGEACAHLALGKPLPQRLVDAGLSAALLAPRVPA